MQSFKLTYHAGRYGLDDTGSIKIVHRYSNDWGVLQMEDPAGLNYVTAVTSNGTPLELDYHPYGHVRPWYRVLRVFVTGGYLSEGDTITVTFGDRTGGSPGLQLQTFCESDFEFKVLADVCATGHYVPIVETPSIAIVPGKAYCWKAVLPSLRRPGETFQFGIKAEDVWGNPTHQAGETLHFKCSLPVRGLPDESEGAELEIETNHVGARLNLGDIGMEDVVLDAGGLYRKIRVFRLPETNPVREMRSSVRIPVQGDRDNPIWVRVTTEDGFLAWSSPVFVYR